MMDKTDLKFHETFQPQAQYLAELLRLAADTYEGNKKEISSITGIPTGEQKGKVVPHVKYAWYMGLIENFNEKKGVIHLALSSMGKEVYSNDPYLQEQITLLICHGNIASSAHGAPQWQYLYRNLPHRIDIPVTQDFVKKNAEEYFGMPVELGITINSYDSGYFAPLRLMEQFDGALLFHRCMASQEAIYVYGYMLLEEWEKKLPDISEITFDELNEQLKIAELFNFDADELKEMLDLLAEAGMVVINRQFLPMTVAKMKFAEELIPLMYSNLL
jgi:hypothetical protein